MDFLMMALRALLMLHSSKHSKIHVWLSIVDFLVINPGSGQAGRLWLDLTWMLYPSEVASLVVLPIPFCAHLMYWLVFPLISLAMITLEGERVGVYLCLCEYAYSRFCQRKKKISKWLADLERSNLAGDSDVYQNDTNKWIWTQSGVEPSPLKRQQQR